MRVSVLKVSLDLEPVEVDEGADSVFFVVDPLPLVAEGPVERAHAADVHPAREERVLVWARVKFGRGSQDVGAYLKASPK